MSLLVDQNKIYPNKEKRLVRYICSEHPTANVLHSPEWNDFWCSVCQKTLNPRRVIEANT